MRARSVPAVIALAAVALAGVAAPVSAGPPARVVGAYRGGPVAVDGSTLLSVPLPAGSWAVLASGLVLHDSAEPQGVSCTLQAGWDFDMVSTSNGRTARTLAIPVGARGTLTELPLPKGRWWVTAKFEAQPDDSQASALDCRIELGSWAADYTGAVVRDQIGPGEISVVQLQHARRLASPGSARVRCAASHATTASWFKIIAFRAGRLSIDGTSGGDGTPAVHLASKPGPVTIAAGIAYKTAASLSIPSGGWMLLATATAANASGTVAGYLDCRIGTFIGSTRIVDVDLSAGAPHRRSAVSLLAVDSANHPRAVSLRCRAGVTPLRLTGIRIAAIAAPQISISSPAEPVDHR